MPEMRPPSRGESEMHERREENECDVPALKEKLAGRTIALHRALWFAQNQRLPGMQDINEMRRSLGWADLPEEFLGYRPEGE